MKPQLFATTGRVVHFLQKRQIAFTVARQSLKCEGGLSQIMLTAFARTVALSQKQPLLSVELDVIHRGSEEGDGAVLTKLLNHVWMTCITNRPEAGNSNHQDTYWLPNKVAEKELRIASSFPALLDEWQRTS